MKSKLIQFKRLWDQSAVVKRSMLDMDSYPLCAEIDLTNICDHKCKWCWNAGFMSSTPTSLKSKIVFPLLDELKECGVKHLLFSGGGEPTLHTSFDKIIKYAKCLDFSIGVVTNGENVLKKLHTLNTCVDNIEISLDSASYEVFKKTHRKEVGSFTNIWQGLKKLCSTKKTRI